MSELSVTDSTSFLICARCETVLAEVCEANESVLDLMCSGCGRRYRLVPRLRKNVIEFLDHDGEARLVQSVSRGLSVAVDFQLTRPRHAFGNVEKVVSVLPVLVPWIAVLFYFVTHGFFVFALIFGPLLFLLGLAVVVGPADRRRSAGTANSIRGWYVRFVVARKLGRVRGVVDHDSPPAMQQRLLTEKHKLIASHRALGERSDALKAAKSSSEVSRRALAAKQPSNAALLEQRYSQLAARYDGATERLHTVMTEYGAMIGKVQIELELLDAVGSVGVGFFDILRDDINRLDEMRRALTHA